MDLIGQKFWRTLLLGGIALILVSCNSGSESSSDNQNSSQGEISSSPSSLGTGNGSKNLSGDRRDISSEPDPVDETIDLGGFDSAGGDVMSLSNRELEDLEKSLKESILKSLRRLRHLVDTSDRIGWEIYFESGSLEIFQKFFFDKSANEFDPIQMILKNQVSFKITEEPCFIEIDESGHQHQEAHGCYRRKMDGWVVLIHKDPIKNMTLLEASNQVVALAIHEMFHIKGLGVARDSEGMRDHDLIKKAQEKILADFPMLLAGALHENLGEYGDYEKLISASESAIRVLRNEIGQSYVSTNEIDEEKFCSAISRLYLNLIVKKDGYRKILGLGDVYESIYSNSSLDNFFQNSILNPLINLFSFCPKSTRFTFRGYLIYLVKT